MITHSNILKKLALVFLWSMSLFAEEAPALVTEFFKRFTEQMGASPKWTFSTKLITTDWGRCVISTDEIIVTLDGQTVTWSVPGGPWAIEYDSQKKRVECVKYKPLKWSESIRPIKTELFSLDYRWQAQREMLESQKIALINVEFDRVYAVLMKNAAKIDKQFIDAWIAEIKPSLKKDVLIRLKDKIEPSCRYHKERIGKKRSISDLQGIAMVTVISATLGGISYGIYKKWHKGSNDIFDQTTQQLYELGIRVSENTNFYGNLAINNINLVKTRKLSLEEDLLALQMSEALLRCRKNVDWAIVPEFICGTLSLGAGILASLGLLEWLFPKHKEYYEKFSLVLNKIEQAIVK